MELSEVYDIINNLSALFVFLFSFLSGCVTGGFFWYSLHAK